MAFTLPLNRPGSSRWGDWGDPALWLVFKTLDALED